MDNRTIRLSELERAREYVASSMHDRDKSWGDLVRKGERDDCPEMRMVLKAMASEAALSALPAVDGWLDIESAQIGDDVLLCLPSYGISGKHTMAVGRLSIDGFWYSDEGDKPFYRLHSPTHYMPLPAPPIE